MGTSYIGIRQCFFVMAAIVSFGLFNIFLLPTIDPWWSLGGSDVQELFIINHKNGIW